MAMLPTPVFEAWGSTDIEIILLKYTWTIRNFSLCYHKNGDAIRSPTFWAETNNKVKWCLDLYPYGDDEESAGYISLYLNLHSDEAYKSVVKANYSFSILNNNGQHFYKLNLCSRFEPEDGFGIPKFIARKVLYNKKTIYLNNDALVILCEMEVTAECERTAEKFLSSQTHLANDFAALLQNKSLSDVTFHVGEKQFKAHKAILAARSPVFRAMFEHNFEERKKGIVNITDFDHQVVGEMLRYIYSEKIADLKGMASDLLAVAEKYAINGLKDQCERVMCASISMENVVKFFILADLYQTAHLKTSVKQYIYTNVLQVVETPEWKELNETHPWLVKELFLMK